jgi:hypothetical protein
MSLRVIFTWAQPANLVGTAEASYYWRPGPFLRPLISVPRLVRFLVYEGRHRCMLFVFVRQGEGGIPSWAFMHDFSVWRAG